MTEPHDTIEHLVALRRRMVAQRLALSAQTLEQAAERMAGHLVAQAAFETASRIAVYLAVRGEADPGAIATAARRQGKAVYLPVLDGQTLVFRHWQPDGPMRPNRYGIPEPAEGEVVAAEALDLVLAPLVAFDGCGHRVGMGGGFYDRTFEFRLGRLPPPWLIGVAHDFQRHGALPTREWDVPLDGVVTPSGYQAFDRLQSGAFSSPEVQ